MENTARLYNCARCHCQVIICSHCDRGNIYCGKSCADLARKTSLSAAGKRYQRTRRGRLKHADRQRHYRSRCKKVTHQGSPDPASNDPLITRPEAPAPVAIIEDKGVHCHFCGRPCSVFVRLDFLYRTPPPLAAGRNVIHRLPRFWAQGP